MGPKYSETQRYGNAIAEKRCANKPKKAGGRIMKSSFAKTGRESTV